MDAEFECHTQWGMMCACAKRADGVSGRGQGRPAGSLALDSGGHAQRRGPLPTGAPTSLRGRR